MQKVLRISMVAGLLVIVSNVAKYEVRKEENFRQEEEHDDGVVSVTPCSSKPTTLPVLTFPLGSC